MQVGLFISMLVLGVIYTSIYHMMLTPLFNNWLIHCIVLGLVFGVINYFIALVFWRKYTILKNNNDKLHTEIRKDKLTGLFNRKAFDQDLESISEDQTYAVIFLDVDNFRNFNNRYGHEVGDSVLRKVAMTIKGNIRSSDNVYRYGGEEIVILLKDCDKKQAHFIGEKIRASIERLNNIPYSKITVSLGIASFPDDSDTLLKVIEYADKALLYAKRHGKNRSILYTPTVETNLLADVN